MKLLLPEMARSSGGDRWFTKSVDFWLTKGALKDKAGQG